MSKKVLIIGLTNRMGGVETFIYNSTIFSDKSRFEYDYLVHGSRNCVFEQEINQFYGDESHIYFVRKYKANPIGCIKDLIVFYRDNGKKYDVIHLQTGMSSEVLYVFPYMLFLRAKLLSHSHNGNGKSIYTNKIFRPLLNFLTKKRAACSLVASKWLFGEKRAQDAVIVNNGIDAQKYAFSEEKRQKVRKEYNIINNFVVGHVGRFTTQKNHKLLLKIFAEIYKKNENAILMLLGTGELEGEVRQQCLEMGLEHSVIFCGVCANTEDYYSAFDVFIMPSLYEGLPIVGIEAQAAGLTCFFSNAISEQIKITDLANIIPLESSCTEWADIIINKNRSVERICYAKKIQESGYDIRTTINVLEELYEC